jgi:hypothetical protein
MHGGDEKCSYTQLMVVKLGGKRPLGRPRRRWKDYIKSELIEIVLEAVDWIHLAHGRDRWRAL